MDSDFSIRKPVMYSVPLCALPPQTGAEKQGHADVAGRKHKAFAHADLALIPMQDSEIQRQQGDHNQAKDQPQPCGVPQQWGMKKFDHGNALLF
jgi:hypothetical protein